MKQFVKKKVKWKTYRDVFTEKGVKSADKDGVGNTADIKLKLLQIVKDPNILTEYRNRAFKCLERNHQKKHVLNQITNDFNEIMGRQIYESPAS